MLLPRSQTPPQEPLAALSGALRPVLGSSTSFIAATSSTRGTTAGKYTAQKALPNNGAAGFAVFRDNEVPAQSEGQEGWTDFGTNASRNRENAHVAVPWKGETLPMHLSSSLSRSQGATFEIFRDEVCRSPTLYGDG